MTSIKVIEDINVRVTHTHGSFVASCEGSSSLRVFGDFTAMKGQPLSAVVSGGSCMELHSEEMGMLVIFEWDAGTVRIQ